MLADDAVVASADASATPDVRAFDPYLAGLAMLRQSGDLSRLKEAERQFSEAVAIAPSFARAHAGLCQARLRIYDRTRDPADVAGAEESCRVALDLDPALVETEKALGALYLSSGRPGEAERIYRAFVARTPQDADGHIGLGRALEQLGNYEAAEAASARRYRRNRRSGVRTVPSAASCSRVARRKRRSTRSAR